MALRLKQTYPRLSQSFYSGDDILFQSRCLLGMHLCTFIAGRFTSGAIVEAEAYQAPDDKACHAYGNRLTKRTEVMFRAGGVAYIYLCYGVHHMFNVVTGPAGKAQAILIRAVQPEEGLNHMLQRRKMSKVNSRLTSGPGVLGQALGMHTQYSGAELTAPQTKIWIEDRGFPVEESKIQSGPRVGVASAGHCATWNWRFWISDNPWVSRWRA